MDLDLLRGQQPELQCIYKNNNLRVIMPLNLVFGLHILHETPKPGVALFAASLIVLNETARTTQ